MKLIKFLYIILAGLFLTWSCTEDENMEPVGNWEITEPVLSTPAGGNDIVLNENQPNSTIRFEWQPAVTSNGFIVTYEFVLVPAESNDYSNPLLKLSPGNGKKELFVQTTAEQLDYALWNACYPAGAKVNLKWMVVGQAIDRQVSATQNIAFTRFATDVMPDELYLTGSATETGADPANAIMMKALKDSDGNLTHIFELYTTLSAGGSFRFTNEKAAGSHVYGGANGQLADCGAGIQVEETGQYRVTVNLNDKTYQLLKIEKWSLVGDAVAGGWGGDVPLEYQGDGVWSSKIEFFRPYDGAGFIFRANGDWAYLLKRVKGTADPDNNGGKVVMESMAGAAGLEFEDMPGPEPAFYTVTLDLSADGFMYKLVKEISTEPVLAIIGKTNNADGDAVSGSFVFGTYDLPAQLFLVASGAPVAELTRDGNTFKSNKYLALQASQTYILNSASDGSGTTYNEIGDGSIAVERDQAYQLTVNFENGKLNWKYYNLKLFHWDEAGGGWDQRLEEKMTYVHPYTFEITANLSGGFHSKFISPWDIQFGTDASGLTGTMTNGGANYTGIVQSGNYKAVIIVSDNYTTGQYTFTKL